MRDMLARQALRIAVGVVMAAATLLGVPVAAQACAVCWGSSADHSFTWGILFLMVMPFTIVGSIGAWLLYRYRHPSEGDPQKTVPAHPTSTSQLIQKESRN